MGSIPGVRFDISGASGSQGLLSPKSGWFVYVLPRGAYASQDSTGTTITFDTSDIASRYAVNNWIQVGLNTSNLRKVNGVGGNSITVAGSAVTVTEDDRVFIIGNTQPSVTGGSATYIIPSSFIYHRDDDTSDRYTNSMLTSTSTGLIQFYTNAGLYDAIIQDSNLSNQGSISDLPVGVAEGVSTSLASIFGATVTFNAAIGVTGTATFGASVVFNGAMGVTGWATFGSTVTMNSTLGVTGLASFAQISVGQTATLSGTSGNYTHTGTVTFGQTATFTGQIVAGTINASWLYINRGTAHSISDYTLGAGWGTGSTITLVEGETNYDARWEVGIFAGTTTSYPATFSFPYKNGPYLTIPIHLENVSSTGDTRTINMLPGGTTTSLSVSLATTPVSGATYFLRGIVIG